MGEFLFFWDHKEAAMGRQQHSAEQIIEHQHQKRTSHEKLAGHCLLFLSYILLSSGAFAFHSVCGSGEPEETLVVRVVDGDTFVVSWNGTQQRVRLIGVDTPESNRNAKVYRDASRSGRSIEILIEEGKRAKEFVKRLLHPGDLVRLEFDVQQRDRYRRLLAYVYLSDGRMLNEVLLQEGYASIMTVPPNVKHVENLLKAYRSGSHWY